MQTNETTETTETTETPRTYNWAEQSKPQAFDLARHWHEAQASGEPVEVSTCSVDGQAEGVEVLWYPRIGRAGVVTGADAIWTDASDEVDAVRRVLTGDVIS